MTAAAPGESLGTASRVHRTPELRPLDPAVHTGIVWELARARDLAAGRRTLRRLARGDPRLDDFVALGPALVAELFGLRGLGGLLGVLYTSAAVGSAVGPPAAGAVIRKYASGPGALQLPALFELLPNS